MGFGVAAISAATGGLITTAAASALPVGTCIGGAAYAASRTGYGG
jgi:hypothetical protein